MIINFIVQSNNSTALQQLNNLAIISQILLKIKNSTVDSFTPWLSHFNPPMGKKVRVANSLTKIQQFRL